MTDAKEKNRQIWDLRYGNPGYFYGTQPNRWLASKADYFRPGMRVLAPADGEGRNSIWCAEMGMVADAFDLSAVAVEKAKKLAAERGVNISVAVSSIDEWEWPVAVYDAVLLVFLNFATPGMRNRLFSRCMAALKPGGLLLLQGYTVRQLEYGTGGPSVAEQLYTEAMLREAFSPLEILEMESYDAVLGEGEGHRGLSALVGMVAKNPRAF